MSDPIISGAVVPREEQIASATAFQHKIAELHAVAEVATTRARQCLELAERLAVMAHEIAVEAASLSGKADRYTDLAARALVATETVDEDPVAYSESPF